MLCSFHMRKKLPKHLGRTVDNNYTCIDFPVCQYLLKNFKIASLLDIGCANGDLVKYFRNQSIDAHGIDGDYFATQIYSDIKVRSFLQTHDYCQGPSVLNKNFDLILSYDFLEHVQERFIPYFMKDFKLGEKLVVSTPSPGCPGWHHVNCQNEKYWIELFRRHGFTHNIVISHDLKNISKVTDPHFDHTQFDKFKQVFFFEKNPN